MDKQPKLMNYSRIKGVYDAHLGEIVKHAFINNELGMLYGSPNMFLMIIHTLFVASFAAKIIKILDIMFYLCKKRTKRTFLHLNG